MGDALAGQAGEIEEDDNVNLPFLLSLSGFLGSRMACWMMARSVSVRSLPM